MKLSSPVVGAGVLGLSLGIGAMILVPTVHGGQARKPIIIAHDSPVTIRGGSITARNSKAEWLLGSTADIWTIDLKKLAANIKLRDVIYTDPNVPNDPNAQTIRDSIIGPLTNNWQLTLSFRRNDGVTEDPTTQLTLCSAIPAGQNSCSISGPLDSKGTVYLLSDERGTFSQELLDRPIKRLRYHLDACHGSTDLHPPCDHIYAVTVTGTGPATDLKYQCPDGECTIEISDKPFS